jgi:hypothetical protein
MQLAVDDQQSTDGRSGCVDLQLATLDGRIGHQSGASPLSTRGSAAPRQPESPPSGIMTAAFAKQQEKRQMPGKP